MRVGNRKESHGAQAGKVSAVPSSAFAGRQRFDCRLCGNILAFGGGNGPTPILMTTGLRQVLQSMAAAASLAAQAVFFVGLAFATYDVISVVRVFGPQVEDASMLVPYLRETLDSYQPTLASGIVGAIVGYAVLFKSGFRASWFLSGTRIVGWLWLPFVPIGTLIGIVLLGARRSALDAGDEEAAENGRGSPRQAGGPDAGPPAQ